MTQPTLPFVSDALTPEEQEMLARAILAEASARFPLRRPVHLEWRNYRTTAGLAQYRSNSIFLARHLLRDRESLRATLLHEYAHLLAFQRHGRKGVGHGTAWRKAMEDLGQTPEVRHSLDCRRNEIRQVVVLQCATCGAEFIRARMLNRRRKYFHVGCGGAIQFVRRQPKTEMNSSA